MNATLTQAFIHRRPLAASALVVGIPGVLEVLLKVTLEDVLLLQLSVLAVGIISGAVLSVLGALTIGRLGLWRELGLHARPARARSLLWFLPFVMYALLPLTVGADLTVGKAAASIVFGLLVAFWKLAVLALVLYAWLPGGTRRAAAATAGLWAGMHLFFGVLTGATVLPTLVLAVSYLFLAFAFVAVRLRTGLMWPLLPCYGLVLATAVAVQSDTASNLASSVEDLLPPLVISILLAGYGLAAWPRHRTNKADARPLEHGRPHPSAGDNRGVYKSQ